MGSTYQKHDPKAEICNSKAAFRQRRSRASRARLVTSLGEGLAGGPDLNRCSTIGSRVAPSAFSFSSRHRAGRQVFPPAARLANSTRSMKRHLPALHKVAGVAGTSPWKFTAGEVVFRNELTA